MQQEINKLLAAMQLLADKQKVQIYLRFFKTGKGQYGEGDHFWGITVPKVRNLAKANLNLNLEQLSELISSPIHEVRLLALLILTYQYPKSNLSEREAIFQFYLSHTASINNWDLVDLSATTIVGQHLSDKSRQILRQLANSKLIWERRIAVLACFYFIRKHDFADILQLAKLLLKDEHDLMHKAVGWMLREVGKRDRQTLLNFLQAHIHEMPRTMLRYAIEKFPEEERQKFLHLKSAKT